MTDRCLLVLDEGTTSTRAILYAPDGTRIASTARELTQFYPQPGWVEHDATEIWDHTLACAQAMVEHAGGAENIAAIGVTNQRETVVAWDRRSGAPIARAIVWQDRRTAQACAALRQAGHEAMVQGRTGLVLDPYFCASKYRWLLDNVPAARDLDENLALGTIDSWLAFKLTGQHITDASNASRTQLLALDGADWDDELLALFGVSRAALPHIVDNAGQFGMTAPDLLGGAIPLCALVGDQQSAMIGQGCLAPGDTKATLGTGAFLLTNRGNSVPRSDHRLLGTVLCQLAGKRTYALEGSVFVAGSLIKWLRDSLGLIADAAETEALARSVADSGGVVLVPALSGLGAPHWRPDARGVIAGLSHASTRAHVVRAALEAMAQQVHNLQTAFAADGAPWSQLRLDGGMSANDFIAQDLSDLLDLTVERPRDVETTALGAAMLAGVGCGLFADLAAAGAMRPATTRFTPAMDPAVRKKRLAAWQAALRLSIGESAPL